MTIVEELKRQWWKVQRKMPIDIRDRAADAYIKTLSPARARDVFNLAAKYNTKNTSFMLFVAQRFNLPYHPQTEFLFYREEVST